MHFFNFFIVMYNLSLSSNFDFLQDLKFSSKQILLLDIYNLHNLNHCVHFFNDPAIKALNIYVLYTKIINLLLCI